MTAAQFSTVSLNSDRRGESPSLLKKGLSSVVDNDPAEDFFAPMKKLAAIYFIIGKFTKVNSRGRAKF